MYYLLSISGNIPWWGGLLIGIVVTVICFVPPIGAIYPLIIGIYILAALIKSFIDSSGFFWLLLAIFILHVVRFVAMLTFCRSNPEKSLEYDTAIKYGYKHE